MLPTAATLAAHVDTDGRARTVTGVLPAELQSLHARYLELRAAVLTQQINPVRASELLAAHQVRDAFGDVWTIVPAGDRAQFHRSRPGGPLHPAEPSEFLAARPWPTPAPPTPASSAGALPTVSVLPTVAPPPRERVPRPEPYAPLPDPAGHDVTPRPTGRLPYVQTIGPLCAVLVLWLALAQALKAPPPAETTPRVDPDLPSVPYAPPLEDGEPLQPLPTIPPGPDTTVPVGDELPGAITTGTVGAELPGPDTTVPASGPSPSADRDQRPAPSPAPPPTTTSPPAGEQAPSPAFPGVPDATRAQVMRALQSGDPATAASVVAEPGDAAQTLRMTNILNGYSAAGLVLQADPVSSTGAGTVGVVRLVDRAGRTRASTQVKWLAGQVNHWPVFD